MKISKNFRIVGGLLAVTMILTCGIFGSMAKYVATGTGEDSVKVAKWSFNVSDKDIVSTTDEFTFKLFDETLASHDEEGNDVDQGLVAPGTLGSFKIDLENASEVTAKYGIEFSAVQNNNPMNGGQKVMIPIEYSLQGGDAATDWTKNIEDLNIAPSDATELEMNGGSTSKTVYWRWTFEGNGDDLDTLLGKAAADGNVPEVVVTAVVDAIQVD